MFPNLLQTPSATVTQRKRLSTDQIESEVALCSGAVSQPLMCPCRAEIIGPVWLYVASRRCQTECPVYNVQSYTACRMAGVGGFARAASAAWASMRGMKRPLFSSGTTTPEVVNRSRMLSLVSGCVAASNRVRRYARRKRCGS